MGPGSLLSGVSESDVEDERGHPNEGFCFCRRGQTDHPAECWRCDYGFIVDLDDVSTDYAIYNNLMLGRGLKLREGCRRGVRNNILLNNALYPHCWYEASLLRIRAVEILATRQMPNCRCLRCMAACYRSADLRI